MFRRVFLANCDVFWPMQKLADYIGLPCRIARGCKYCVADHRASCLVKIEDDKQLSRSDNCLLINHKVKIKIKEKY